MKVKRRSSRRVEDEKARRAEEDFKKNRKKYESEEALITARVEEEEMKEKGEVLEESGDEVPRIDLQQVTAADNEQVCQLTNTIYYIDLLRLAQYICSVFRYRRVMRVVYCSAVLCAINNY